MLIERMRKRLASDRASFIEPCLPPPADKPASGSNWIHEIKDEQAPPASDNGRREWGSARPKRTGHMIARYTLPAHAMTGMFGIVATICLGFSLAIFATSRAKSEATDLPGQDAFFTGNDVH
jgi:hypothetical protein